MSRTLYYTRNGHKVTLLKTDLVNDKPIVGIVHQPGYEFICQWDHFGSFFGPNDDGSPTFHQLDLVDLIVDDTEALPPPPKSA